MRDRGTHETLDLEERRQDLRDQRWRRWRSMMLTGALSTALVTDQISIKQAIGWLLSATGMT
jgi:hypothetical protein